MEKKHQQNDNLWPVKFHRITLFKTNGYRSLSFTKNLSRLPDEGIMLIQAEMVTLRSASVKKPSTRPRFPNEELPMQGTS